MTKKCYRLIILFNFYFKSDLSFSYVDGSLSVSKSRKTFTLAKYSRIYVRIDRLDVASAAL